MALIWLSCAAIVFSRSTLPRNTTAPFIAGSPATSSIVDGSGIASPSSAIPSCAAPLRASCRRSRSPENPGNSRQNRICCLYADTQCTPWLFSVVAIWESPQFDPGLFLYAVKSPLYTLIDNTHYSRDGHAWELRSLRTARSRFVQILVRHLPTQLSGRCSLANASRSRRRTLDRAQ